MIARWIPAVFFSGALLSGCGPDEAERTAQDLQARAEALKVQSAEATPLLHEVLLGPLAKRCIPPSETGRLTALDARAQALVERAVEADTKDQRAAIRVARAGLDRLLARLDKLERVERAPLVWLDRAEAALLRIARASRSLDPLIAGIDDPARLRAAEEMAEPLRESFGSANRQMKDLRFEVRALRNENLADCGLIVDITESLEQQAERTARLATELEHNLNGSVSPIQD
jgi:hypothetical protein